MVDIMHMSLPTADQFAHLLGGRFENLHQSSAKEVPPTKPDLISAVVPLRRDYGSYITEAAGEIVSEIAQLCLQREERLTFLRVTREDLVGEVRYRVEFDSAI
jgi:hypothetical protein